MIEPGLRQVYSQATQMNINEDALISIARARDAALASSRQISETFKRIGKLTVMDDASIASKHLLVGLSRDSRTGPILLELGMDAKGINDAIVGYAIRPRELKYLGYYDGKAKTFPGLTESAEEALMRAAEEAKMLKASEVNTGHLLLGLSFHPNKELEHIVAGLGLSVGKLRGHAEARITGTISPYDGQSEYVEQQQINEVPLSIRYITAYLNDPNVDPEHKRKIIEGMDKIALHIDEVDPRR